MCGKIHVAGPGRIKIKNKTLKKPIKSSESGQSLGCSDRKNRFFFLYKKTILFGRSNNEQLLNSPCKLYRWQPWCTLINYENIKNVHFPLFLFCLKPLHSYAVISNSNNVSFFFLISRVVVGSSTILPYGTTLIIILNVNGSMRFLPSKLFIVLNIHLITVL